MREEEASSLAGFIDRLNLIGNDWYPTPDSPGTLWFRGQSRKSLPLLPSLYTPEIIARSYEEETLLGDFEAQALISPTPETDWDWYFVARHHGMPSRLLDWTENAFVALWFAIAGLIPDKESWRKSLLSPPDVGVFGDDGPAVWLIDPGSLNKWAFGEDRIFFVGTGFSEHWLPHWVSRPSATTFVYDQKEYSNLTPMAIFPNRRTPRIIAQQAVFTVHGFDRTPLNELMVQNEAGGALIARVLLRPESVARVFDELETAGVTRFGLFPDADNLVKKIMWDYW